MINYFFKIFLTINATSWVVAVYGVKEEWTIYSLSSFWSGLIILALPIVFSGISILLTRYLGKDNIETCIKLEEANNVFLPVYLAYFFIGFSIDATQHLILVYVIIFMFTYATETQYFNPIFLLFGLRHYRAETESGTMVFLIVRENLRKPTDVKFSDLRRINDVTYIEWGKR